ncbi:hypothetical protein PR202_ga05483 [Eleusine coracana subsp. coracana]|uniref:STAR protein homodimerisation region domain-containing protein n=1 Tax=Eleusine coracana subsp. coracana TaxID=191504 RepID=A0AAV5BSG9_ELECO|nr:hypothetical protein PR202_ga05027 [Eleusine coracana subsp. coracana]GJM88904.1 hypothetical protein PR202_ga05030 [Eleusine coracana subsp. coracana]GJM89302.1 hypothetical protein PR202_ga05480 [Eleusine coracana subsp. coracana]GJM89305.1 hypothetical protein PR202_ga05483 [Eleusine coracana subsp. coracana]
MDGLHGTDACFSPGQAMSPQVRPPGPPDIGSQYLAELLQEHQKLGPFMQVLPICSRLLNQGESFDPAELPANVIDSRLAKAQEILEELLKPVDESQDYYKRQQLRELAMLNSPLREESPHPGGAPPSPFNTGGMKRMKQ